MCIWLCTVSVHNVTQNSSDDLPSNSETNIIAQMLSIGNTVKNHDFYTNVLLLVLLLILLLLSFQINNTHTHHCYQLWSRTHYSTPHIHCGLAGWCQSHPAISEMTQNVSSGTLNHTTYLPTYYYYPFKTLISQQTCKMQAKRSKTVMFKISQTVMIVTISTGHYRLTTRLCNSMYKNAVIWYQARIFWN